MNLWARCSSKVGPLFAQALFSGILGGTFEVGMRSGLGSVRGEWLIRGFAFMKRPAMFVKQQIFNR